MKVNVLLPGWGNILSGVQKAGEKLQNKVQEQKNALNTNINNAIDKTSKNLGNVAGGVVEKLGGDPNAVKNEINKGAGVVKGAVNCFFGKCSKDNPAPHATAPSGADEQKQSNQIPTTLPGGKNIPVTTISGTDAEKEHPKNVDDAADDLAEFGDGKNSKKTSEDKEFDVKSLPSQFTTETITTVVTEEVVEEEKPQVTETIIEEEFTMNKKKIQLEIDPRYVIMKMQDEYMNPDNTIRFVATDTTDLESVSLKLYFKGRASDRVFYSQNDDPTFTNSINECKNHKIINNRLYNKPMVNMEPINLEKDKPIFDDILVPRCLTQPDSGNLKTAYINIYSLPEGTRLDKKCLKGLDLTKQNSCLPYIRPITTGLLHALKLFNMGSSFYRHGNIFPHNIYFNIKKDAQRVFLDNMLYDSNKYDDINQKPFRRDMHMMADSLISFITGSRTNPLKEPLRSTFEIYHGIKRYLWDNFIDLPLKSSAINMQSNMKEGNGKNVTKAEWEFKLLKSVFNFIYRLKCTGTDPYNQFMDIDQALHHDFITSGMEVGPTANGEQWDSSPSDY